MQLLRKSPHTILLVILLFVVGCATPAHYLKETESISPENLATVSIRTNEIYILEINDEKYKVEQTAFKNLIYLQPGKYKFTAKLTWENLIPVAGVTISTETHSQNLRTGCLTLKAGASYHLYARNPGDDWKFVVSNQETGSFNYLEVPEC